MVDNNRWYPLTWKDEPEFMEFAKRYDDERLNDIVALALVQPEHRKEFLTQVLMIAQEAAIQIEKRKIVLAAKDRKQLESLRKTLKALNKRLGRLSPAITNAIAVEAKVEVTRALYMMGKSETIDESIEWKDAEKNLVRTTPGRPGDAFDIQVWQEAGIGHFMTRGGEEYIQAVSAYIRDLSRWAELALSNNPKREPNRPNEVIVRGAIRRLLKLWEESGIVPSERGPFSRFVEKALRPALGGYWPDGRIFESAIEYVLEGAK